MQTTDILHHFNLLFVDDDIQVASDAYALFSPQFKSVALAHTAPRAMELIKQGGIDVVITDIEMPGQDGLSLVEKIRATDADLPVIVLSGFSEQDYLFRAANLRIDGYIIKPISSKKLEPVLNKVALRLQGKLSKLALADNVFYDLASQILSVDGSEISLGKKERDLLNLFANKPGRIISQADIKKAIWSHDEMTDSALKNLLSELRKKLKYNLIKNIPARGWILTISGMND